MTCTHCNAIEQRGRYCVGCGKLFPPALLPSRRPRLAPRYDDETQPVLRFRTPRLPADGQVPATIG